MTSPRGSVDLYNVDASGAPTRFVEGWAYEPGFDGYNEVHVWEFSDKGEALRVIGSGTANLPRPDVATVFPDAPRNCGFKVELTRDGSRNVVVFAIDAPGTLGSNANLTGAPKAVVVPKAPAPPPTPTPAPASSVSAWSRVISLANQISDIGEDNV
jgi:hypothetical protein